MFCMFWIFLMCWYQKWFLKNKKKSLACISAWKVIWKATATTLPNIPYIVELTFFFSEDKECMLLLSLLKKIHHTSLSLVAKEIYRLQIRNSHLLTIISGRWIILYSTSIIIDTWMVGIHSCWFFYLRTSSWSQPRWFF